MTSCKTYAYMSDTDLSDNTPALETSYTYSTGPWGDMLTSYNSTSITYDEMGNMLKSRDGFIYTWQGNKLVSVETITRTYKFTYNELGLRSSKTTIKSNGTVVSTTNYYYDGNLLIAEVTDGDIIVYLYDINGSPVGMQYRESTYAANTWDIFRLTIPHILEQTVARMDIICMLIVVIIRLIAQTPQERFGMKLKFGQKILLGRVVPPL